MMTKKVLFLHCVAEFNGIVTFDTLEPPDLKKKYIAYVGTFEHFSVQLFLHVFCNSSKTITNSSEDGRLMVRCSFKPAATK